MPEEPMLWANKHMIWKYSLDPTAGYQVIEMPAGAKIVKVGSQGNIVFWAEVNVNAPLERRLFRIYGTGHKIDDNDIYIGSVQQPPYVWHVYESNP